MKRPSARELEPALDALPLFPLPAVLFPGALMPLHVFEPRYRAMVKDCLATHGALAIAYVTSAEATDVHGHPRIAEVAGAGLIVDHAELPNGRYNILVEGRARVRLTENPFVPPYRTARAQVIPAADVDVPEHEVTALRAAAMAFASRVREREPRFELSLPQHVAGDALADVVAHHLVLDARERQALLELGDPIERVRRTTEILVVQRVALSPNKNDLN